MMRKEKVPVPWQRNLRAWTGLCLLIFVSLGWEPRAAEESTRVADLKQQLEQEIQRLNSEYQEIRQIASSVVDDLERLRVEIRLLEKELDLLELQRNETLDTLDRTQQDLAQLEDQRTRYEAFITARVRTLYRMGPLYPFKILLSLEKGKDLLRGVYYAHALAHLDQVYLERYRNLIRDLKQRRAYLKALENTLDYQVRQMHARRQRLHRARARKERLLALLRKRGSMYHRALQELTIAFNRLSDFVGNSRYRPLLDIRQFKGLLDWPVDGPVVRPFGRIRLQDTGTYILSRGIEIAVPEGTPVRAVFNGEVRFAGWFTSYGKLIILDHGNDIYTLYAHNSVLRCRPGQQVRKGQVIALSGRTASLRGPVLYFEIRRQIQAENPLEWLRIVPRIAASR